MCAAALWAPAGGQGWGEGLENGWHLKKDCERQAGVQAYLLQEHRAGCRPWGHKPLGSPVCSFLTATSFAPLACLAWRKPSTISCLRPILPLAQVAATAASAPGEAVGLAWLDRFCSPSCAATPTAWGVWNGSRGRHSPAASRRPEVSRRAAAGSGVGEGVGGWMPYANAVLDSGKALDPQWMAGAPTLA